MCDIMCAVKKEEEQEEKEKKKKKGQFCFMTDNLA